MKALILGSTGLTGSFLLQHLLKDDYFREVTILVRKKTNMQHHKLLEVITDFSGDLKDISAEINCDILFSCLGTTRRKTPDLNTYRNIEIHIPEKIARIAKDKGLQQLHYISAIGAKRSSWNDYLNMKGLAEEKLRDIDIPHLYIYRPSLIMGKRKETRLSEKIAQYLFQIINPFLIGSMKKYRSINAERIATFMIEKCKSVASGKVNLYHTDDMLKR
jgi:uncharacterized protein YbjT (DUF2867 family)